MISYWEKDNPRTFCSAGTPCFGKFVLHYFSMKNLHYHLFLLIEINPKKAFAFNKKMVKSENSI